MCFFHVRHLKGNHKVAYFDRYQSKRQFITKDDKVPSTFNCLVASLLHSQHRTQGTKFYINDFCLQREIRGNQTEADIINVQE